MISKKPEKDFSIKSCDIKEAGEIYKTHMEADFPRDELKPFSAIREMMEAGKYLVFGAYEGDALTGYAYIAIMEKNGIQISLLDYFAVVRGKRGRGTGTFFLKKLFGKLD
ncbi:MAG: GNAT family N-acetyltransferase [Blautia sp.]|nr:GNAT family N-acetyltransferase [Blautia sp.]